MARSTLRRPVRKGWLRDQNRGATKAIPSKPEKQAKLIDEAVAKLARQWEKKYDRGMQ